ncbi:hypothetical protein JXR93_03905 [bacterium]|nr:hypothetical protein [bacterium]
MPKAISILLLIVSIFGCSKDGSKKITQSEVQIEVVAVKPSLESIPYSRVSTKFTNNSQTTITIENYKLQYKDIIKNIKLNKKIVLKPNESYISTTKFGDKWNLKKEDFKPFIDSK